MDSSQRYLAERYAQAFLNMFGKKLTAADLPAIYKAREYFKDHKSSCFLLRFSLLSDGQKYELVKEVRKELGLSEFFDQLFNLIIDHKRTLLLEDLFDVLVQKYEKLLNRAVFQVRSAGELSFTQKKEVEFFLEHSLKKTIVCSYKEDAYLLGGIRIQSNQLLWEDSIRGRLNRIRSRLKH